MIVFYSKSCPHGLKNQSMCGFHVKRNSPNGIGHRWTRTMRIVTQHDTHLTHYTWSVCMLFTADCFSADPRLVSQLTLGRQTLSDLPCKHAASLFTNSPVTSETLRQLALPDYQFYAAVTMEQLRKMLTWAVTWAVRSKTLSKVQIRTTKLLNTPNCVLNILFE